MTTRSERHDTHPSIVDRLQDGIYFRSGEHPPPCYRLLLLNVIRGAEATSVRDALTLVMEMLTRLPDGEVRDLAGQDERGVEATAKTFRELGVLLGFGRRLFDPECHQPPLVQRACPDFLVYLPRDGAAFPAVPWDDSGRLGAGEADLVVQLTGHNEAAVNRAAVEVWKLLNDLDLPLQTFASFRGFQRHDGRGWLGFHDGVSNVETSQRLAAIEAAADPGWMAGGTYMAFLRFAVDLAAWRSLPRSHQELIVGRDKLTGDPMVAVSRDESGAVVPVAAPTLPDGSTNAERADYDDPPQTTDPLIEASHTHRANQNRTSPHASAGLRIFRQGYDFLESIGSDGPRLGLNFVSFQSDLAMLQHLLHLPGWLGDVNFGGPIDPKPGEPSSPQLITLLAGGFYAVPPRGEPFAGVELFDTG